MDKQAEDQHPRRKIIKDKGYEYFIHKDVQRPIDVGNNIKILISKEVRIKIMSLK